MTGHNPVMLREMLAALAPKDGGVYIDATFGAGGYTEAILKSANCVVYAIDCDPLAEEIASGFSKHFGPKFCFVRGLFGDIFLLCGAKGVSECDGVVFDVGMSSMQIDDDARGFSFSRDGILDMRMSKMVGDLNAADFINALSQEKLAEIFLNYGEERYANRVAKAIVKYRENKRINSSVELAEIVRSAIPKGTQGAIDPATRTFQAIRIFVNNELEQLNDGLRGAIKMLRPGARVVAVSFHSLEHKIIKKVFKEYSGVVDGANRHSIASISQTKPSVCEFSLLSKRALRASVSEIQSNRRARSAQLRAIARRGDSHV